MRAAFFLTAIWSALAMLPLAAGAEPLVVTKERVSAKLYRAQAKAVLCLSARDPVKLSGEFGVHVSSVPSDPGAKEIDLYDKSGYFPAPVRVEVPLSRTARHVKVEVGACVANDYCDSVELNLELRKALIASTVDSVDCKP